MCKLGKFVQEEFLGQSAQAFVILQDVPNCPPNGIVLVYSPTDKV